MLDDFEAWGLDSLEGVFDESGGSSLIACERGELASGLYPDPSRMCNEESEMEAEVS